MYQCQMVVISVEASPISILSLAQKKRHAPNLNLQPLGAQKLKNKDEQLVFRRTPRSLSHRQILDYSAADCRHLLV
jgi:hypothetical protein